MKPIWPTWSPNLLPSKKKKSLKLPAVSPYMRHQARLMLSVFGAIALLVFLFSLPVELFDIVITIFFLILVIIVVLGLLYIAFFGKEE
jgi:hypothetical protein